MDIRSQTTRELADFIDGLPRRVTETPPADATNGVTGAEDSAVHEGTNESTEPMEASASGDSESGRTATSDTSGQFQETGQAETMPTPIYETIPKDLIDFIAPSKREVPNGSLITKAKPEDIATAAENKAEYDSGAKVIEAEKEAHNGALEEIRQEFVIKARNEYLVNPIEQELCEEKFYDHPSAEFMTRQYGKRIALGLERHLGVSTEIFLAQYMPALKGQIDRATQHDREIIRERRRNPDLYVKSPDKMRFHKMVVWDYVADLIENTLARFEIQERAKIEGDIRSNKLITEMAAKAKLEVAQKGAAKRRGLFSRSSALGSSVAITEVVNPDEGYITPRQRLTDLRNDFERQKAIDTNALDEAQAITGSLLDGLRRHILTPAENGDGDTDKIYLTADPFEDTRTIVRHYGGTDENAEAGRGLFEDTPKDIKIWGYADGFIPGTSQLDLIATIKRACGMYRAMIPVKDNGPDTKFKIAFFGVIQTDTEDEPMPGGALIELWDAGVESLLMGDAPRFARVLVRRVPLHMITGLLRDWDEIVDLGQLTPDSDEDVKLARFSRNQVQSILPTIQTHGKKAIDWKKNLSSDRPEFELPSGQIVT